MAVRNYDLLPPGTDYPVVFRDVEAGVEAGGFRTLELAQIMGAIECKVYADPKVAIVDRITGIEATHEFGLRQSLVHSANTTGELTDRVQFPVSGLKTQSSRRGNTIIGLVTDTPTEEKIQKDRSIAAGIFGVEIVSVFDMLPVCTVFEPDQVCAAAERLAEYLAGLNSDLYLSSATLKMLRSR
jgi:hypothetical protein